MKYHDRHPSGLMLIRAVVSAIVLLVASLADAQPIEARARWRAVATPPRPGLPAVTVEVGYPGEYVPRNSPITLHAKAGDRPFDGYIGFHFRVGDSRTSDSPVVARAVLQPHQSWTFSTFVTLDRSRLDRFADAPRPREVVIDWRNPSIESVAIESAGAPPWRWELSPLRIGSSQTPPTALGEQAYIAPPAALSDRAQWYAGFATVVAPLDVWLALPPPVRKAIFSSRVHAVFYGLPGSGQRFDEITRALLPVTFEAAPGSYRVPWPYGEGQEVAVQLSWSADDDATAIGHGTLPYIVSAGAPEYPGDSAGVTWIADETGIARALPATASIPFGVRGGWTRWAQPDPELQSAVQWIHPGPLFRTLRGALATGAAALICIVAWFAIRRRPRLLIVVALVATAGLTAAARHALRSPSAAHDVEIESVTSPGIVDTFRASRVYGSSPIPPATIAIDTDAVVTEAGENHDRTEIRTANTPVGLGSFVARRDWDATTRYIYSRRVGDEQRVRIRQRNREELVVEYNSPYAINYVHAQWLSGDEVSRGSVAVPFARSGVATIRNQREASREREWFAWEVPQLMSAPAVVTLIQQTSGSTRAFVRHEHDQKQQSFVLIQRKRPSVAPAFTFALPRISSDVDALIRVDKAAKNVTLTWASGSGALTPAHSQESDWTTAYLVPSSTIKEILSSGGIVEASVMFDEEAVSNKPWVNASIEIVEKKQ